MAKKKSKKSGGNKKGGGKTRKSGQSAKSKSPAKAEPKDASLKEADHKVAPASETAAPANKADTTAADTTVPRAIVAGEPAPEPPELVNKLVMVDNAIGYIEQTFLVVVLFSLIGVGTYQFVASHIFKINDTWPFGALRNLVFLTAMGGAALAAQKGRMISMDFVARKFSDKNQVILRMLIAVFVVFTCYLLFTGGMFVREAATAHHEKVDLSIIFGRLVCRPYWEG